MLKASSVFVSRILIAIPTLNPEWYTKKHDTDIRKFTLSNKQNITEIEAVNLFLKRRALNIRKEQNMIPYSRIFLMLSNHSLPKNF